MIDLQKEFRTLRLLSSALLIIGAGLAIGGFAIGLMTRDSSKPKPTPTYVENPSEKTDDAPAKRKPVKDVKLTTYTSSIAFSSGILGLVFIVLGGALRWIISNNIDDDDEVQMSDELFKAYADQLVLAEKQKQKNRKRLK